MRTISGGLTLSAFTARAGVVVMIGAITTALWLLRDLLVLLFGAVLLAIGLCAATRLLSARAGLPRGVALACVFLLAFGLFGAAFWVFGATVVAQMDDVVGAAPAGFRLALAWISANPTGQAVMAQLRGTNVMSATGWATSVVADGVGLITQAFGYAVIALFVAIYLAAQPGRYRHLCLRLVPPGHRAIAARLFDDTGHILERWLAGQFVVMATIGVLSGLGLWVMGIEAAFALGLMGGLLCFIPFVGAILAAVPATLVALTQGPVAAASVVVMYAGVHFVEGNFITPMVQAEATAFPPVLAILSTFAFGVLLGPLGVLLAAPLTLLVMAAAEILYVQDALGEAPEAVS